MCGEIGDRKSDTRQAEKSARKKRTITTTLLDTEKIVV